MNAWVPIVAVVVGTLLGFLGQFLLARQQAERERGTRANDYRRTLHHERVQRLRDRYSHVSNEFNKTMNLLVRIRAYYELPNDPFLEKEGMQATESLSQSAQHLYLALGPLRLEDTDDSVWKVCLDFDTVLASGLARMANAPTKTNFDYLFGETTRAYQNATNEMRRHLQQIEERAP